MEVKSVLQELRLGSFYEALAGAVIFTLGVTLMEWSPRILAPTTVFQIVFGFACTIFGFWIIYNARHYKEEKEKSVADPNTTR